MNFRQQRDYQRGVRLRRAAKDGFGVRSTEIEKGKEEMEMTKLAMLIAARIPSADIGEINKSVKSCQINGLVPAIIGINGEFDGPVFAPGEIGIMCATLGVEQGSGLSSVLHVMSEPVQPLVPVGLPDIRLSKTHWIYQDVQPQAVAVPPVEDEVDEEVRGKFVGDLVLACKNAMRKVSDQGADMILYPDALIGQIALELCGSEVSDSYAEVLEGGGESLKT